jgi:hypothetical protein
MSTSRGAYFKGSTIDSGENVKRIVEARPEQLGDGATVSGVVQRDTTNYDVNLIWVDDDGNEVVTESVASNVSAGTQTTFDVAARSNKCKVQVDDAGSGSGDVDGSAYLG